jgi:mono/diheme cytochrome c family protein
VPLAPLLDFELRDDAVLEAHGADGFAAPLDPKRLMAPLPSGARAHLAIEAPDSPWPPLGEGRPSAGPFAIVWTGDSVGDVSSEEWPYQIVSLRIVGPISERYPGLMPAEELPEDAEERQGLEVFVENCMPCHRLNGMGEAEMGPDLNQPMSPTEYLTDEGLRRLIRNPRSVRHWPASQMPATSEAQVSDPQLDALISYLHHMAAWRGATVR